VFCGRFALGTTCRQVGILHPWQRKRSNNWRLTMLALQTSGCFIEMSSSESGPWTSLEDCPKMYSEPVFSVANAFGCKFIKLTCDTTDDDDSTCKRDDDCHDSNLKASLPNAFQILMKASSSRTTKTLPPVKTAR
jgi:hypothetical protein